MGKINGVSIFNALFTTLNHFSEIRSMTFTPSKAQDGWGPVLSAMLPSLAKFSHTPPKVVFTDSILADKDKLLTIFPSLSSNVTPIPNNCALEELTLPYDWSYVDLPTVNHINLRFSIIMSHHTSVSPVKVAFGVQWPTDPISGKAGQVSLIQIGYQKTVYLIKVILFRITVVHHSHNLL